MRRIGIGIAFAAALALAPADAAENRAVPYWASISAGDALMRSGPGRNFPATWRYRRADLPVKVLQVHETWRKVREPDGTEGWMAAALLSAERTAMVIREIQPMRVAPGADARIVWRAAPGVVGKLKRCVVGWCEFDAGGKVGYLAADQIWGVEPGEVFD